MARLLSVYNGYSGLFEKFDLSGKILNFKREKYSEFRE